MGEEHPPHPRVPLTEELTGPLRWHLTHQGHGEGLELLAEVLAELLPGRGHTVHLAVVATASPRQDTHDNALLVEDAEMPPLHRLEMVVANYRGAGAHASLRPQVRRFFHLQQEG